MLRDLCCCPWKPAVLGLNLSLLAGECNTVEENTHPVSGNQRWLITSNCHPCVKSSWIFPSLANTCVNNTADPSEPAPKEDNLSPYTEIGAKQNHYCFKDPTLRYFALLLLKV